MKKLLFILAILISFTSYSQNPWEFKADKQLHFLAGAGVGYILGDIMYTSERHKDWEVIVYPAFLGFVAGGYKEMFSYHFRGALTSFHDVAYTAMGSVIGSFAQIGVKKLIERKKVKVKL